VGGDEVLINFLGNGRNPDIAIRAGRETLPPDEGASKISRMVRFIRGQTGPVFLNIFKHSCNTSATASEDGDSSDLQGECSDQTSDDRWNDCLDGPLDIEEELEFFD